MRTIYHNPARVIIDHGGPSVVAAGILIAAATVAAVRYGRDIETALYLVLAAMAVLAVAGLAVLARLLIWPEMSRTSRAAIQAAARDQLRAETLEWAQDEIAGYHPALPLDRATRRELHEIADAGRDAL